MTVVKDCIAELQEHLRVPQCFGCWIPLIEESGSLIAPPSHTSSDNVNFVQTMRLCMKCFNQTLEFVMGKESPDYKQGNPTLQEMLLRV